MELQRIVSALPALSGTPTAIPSTATGGMDFGSALKGLLDKLSNTERGTDSMVTRAAAGENIDIHDVMISTQAEGLAFQVGLQVRNKLVEAYHEVFRMQM